MLFRSSDRQGDTPLHLASVEHNREAILALLAAGANTEALNENKERPVDLAPPHLKKLFSSEQV